MSAISLYTCLSSRFANFIFVYFHNSSVAHTRIGFYDGRNILGKHSCSVAILFISLTRVETLLH